MIGALDSSAVQQALHHPRVVRLAASLDIDLTDAGNQHALQVTAQALIHKTALERLAQQRTTLADLPTVQSLTPSARRAILAYLEVAQM